MRSILNSIFILIFLLSGGFNFAAVATISLKAKTAPTLAYQETPYKSISELKTRPQSLKSAQSDEIVDVLGYYSPGDGGGGRFYWDAKNNKPGDGALTIEVEGLRQGRWVRIIEHDDLNVKWFGAKGDDKTNDSEAFNNAIDYAFNNWEGGEVMVPSGKYLVNVQLKRGVTLKGKSPQTTWLKPFTDNPIINWNTNNTDQRHNYDAVVENLRIGNAPKTFVKSRGINIVADKDQLYIDRPIIKNCVIEHNAAEAVYVEADDFVGQMNFVQNLHIENTQIQYNNKGGLYLCGLVIETTIRNSSIIKNGLADVSKYDNFYVGTSASGKEPMRLRVFGGIINNDGKPIGNSVHLKHASSISFYNVNFENGKVLIEGSRSKNIEFDGGNFGAREAYDSFFDIHDANGLSVRNVKFDISGPVKFKTIFNFDRIYANYSNIDIANNTYPSADKLEKGKSYITYTVGRNYKVKNGSISYINSYIEVFNNDEPVLSSINNYKGESEAGIEDNAILTLSGRPGYKAVTVKNGLGNIHLISNEDRVISSNDSMTLMYIPKKGWFEMSVNLPKNSENRGRSNAGGLGRG
tara:strand:+ start:10610 stop:12343 length:1734 start_codon:yes stop_codon:yes gene_type:complete